MLVIYKQTTQPMILIPRKWRYLLMGNVYVFDRDFEEEAAKSNDSYLTPLLNNQQRKSKGERTCTRLARMKDQECCICLLELKINPVA